MIRFLLRVSEFRNIIPWKTLFSDGCFVLVMPCCAFQTEHTEHQILYTQTGDLVFKGFNAFKLQTKKSRIVALYLRRRQTFIHQTSCTDFSTVWFPLISGPNFPLCQKSGRIFVRLTAFISKSHWGKHLNYRIYLFHFTVILDISIVNCPWEHFRKSWLLLSLNVAEVDHKCWNELSSIY